MCATACSTRAAVCSTHADVCSMHARPASCVFMRANQLRACRHRTQISTAHTICLQNLRADYQSARKLRADYNCVRSVQLHANCFPTCTHFACSTHIAARMQNFQITKLECCTHAGFPDYKVRMLHACRVFRSSKGKMLHACRISK